MDYYIDYYVDYNIDYTIGYYRPYKKSGYDLETFASAACAKDFIQRVRRIHQSICDPDL